MKVEEEMEIKVNNESVMVERKVDKTANSDHNGEVKNLEESVYIN